MSEATPVNVQAFEPNNGGGGARLAPTGTTSRVAIPGLEGGQQGDRSRVVISNGGAYSVFICMGGPTVVATTSSYEILPGTKELLKPPNIGPNPVYMAAITAGDTGVVNVCAGSGT